MVKSILITGCFLSLHSRERGLKFVLFAPANHTGIVAPLAGAWIEICSAFNSIGAFLVAPLAGAWIEIDFVRVLFQDIDRRSTRGSVD